MTPEELTELLELRREQQALREAVWNLDRRLELLVEKRRRGSSAAIPPPAFVAEPTHLPPAPAKDPAPLSIPPPSLPLAGVPEMVAAPKLPLPLPVPPPPRSRFSETGEKSEAPRGSFEMELGSVWLARIGIVILLTGLVFLGNYAWQQYVHTLGPGGKVALLYLSSGLLAGLGAWLHRRQESLRPYAQVLLGGGAALAYYTTYAAHFVAPLRVIASPLVDGGLLLLCAGVLLWIADRKRWQVAAVLTILLSYYTAGINPIGDFTLYSNLLLTAAGLFLFLRHRWAALSWVSVAGTYGSYAYWHFYRYAGAGGGLPMEEPWRLGLVFLLAYWVLFTAAVFYMPAAGQPVRRKVAFLSLNNAALLFFGGNLLELHRPTETWLFVVSFATVLLGLAVVAGRTRKEELSFDGAYLVQGLALHLLGLAMKLTGPQLALIFAAESLLLLSGSGRRQGLIYEIFARACAFFAFVDALSQVTQPGPPHLVLGSAVAATLIADAWWLKVRRGVWREGRVVFCALYFAVLGLVLAGAVIHRACLPPVEAGVFALAAVVCTASIYFLRLPEVTLPGQFFLFVAVLVWHHHLKTAAWWQGWPVGAAALALLHWWQWQRRFALAAAARRFLELFGAAVLTLVLSETTWTKLQGDHLLLGLGLSALGTLLYAWATRAWALGWGSQVLAWQLTVCYMLRAGFGSPASGWLELLPIVVLIAECLVLPRLAPPPESEPASPGILAALAPFYWAAGMIALAVWLYQHTPEPWRVLAFAGACLGFLIISAVAKHRHSAWSALAFGGLTFALFWAHLRGGAHLWDLAAILLVPAAMRLGSRYAPAHSTFPLRPVQAGCSALAAFSVWLWATRWSYHQSDGHSLTITWSVTALAMLGTGLAVRERVYRLGGFAILFLAIGRIFTVDVWALETIFRILSFLSLGAVLLLLGFLYSKYSEQIRKWL